MTPGLDTSLFPGPLLGALAKPSRRPAFEHAERSVSRAELLAMIQRFAGALYELGLGPGQSIAILTSVSPEAFALHAAAHTLGCRVVGIRPGYAAPQLAHVLGKSRNALVVESRTISSEVVAAAGTARLFSLGPCPGAVDLLSLPESTHPFAVASRPDDVAALYFTSGSTGKPKGCAVTYRALSAHFAWKDPRGWSALARELSAGFERYLLYGTLASFVVFEFLGPCLLGDGTAVIPAPEQLPEFHETLGRHRITGTIVTVPRFRHMLDRLEVERKRLPELRAIMVSGSPLTPNRLAAAVERLGPVVYHGYGQTEAGSISICTPGDLARDPLRALVSVGRPHEGVEVGVRDSAGRPVARGEIGELYVRSLSQMTAYADQPDETRDVVRDGWICTRDLGRVDELGFIHLAGRTRDVAMVNAMVVYEGPIERVLASHPDVDQAYVATLPDEQTGEALHAFIVPVARRRLDHAALCSLIRAELGEDSVPKTITPISNVPVAPSGKPDKRALLELYGPGAAKASGAAIAAPFAAAGQGASR